MVHDILARIASAARGFSWFVGECKGFILMNRACAIVSPGAMLRQFGPLRQGLGHWFQSQHSQLVLGLTEEVARQKSRTMQEEVISTLRKGGTLLRSRPKWHEWWRWRAHCH